MSAISATTSRRRRAGARVRVPRAAPAPHAARTRGCRRWRRRSSGGDGRGQGEEHQDGLTPIARPGMCRVGNQRGQHGRPAPDGDHRRTPTTAAERFASTAGPGRSTRAERRRTASSMLASRARREQFPTLAQRSGDAADRPDRRNGGLRVATSACAGPAPGSANRIRAGNSRSNGDRVDSSAPPRPLTRAKPRCRRSTVLALRGSPLPAGPRTTRRSPACWKRKPGGRTPAPASVCPTAGSADSTKRNVSERREPELAHEQHRRRTFPRIGASSERRATAAGAGARATA